MADSKSKKEEYNEEPVVYCSRCLSLNIRVFDDECSFCDTCCSTDVEVTDIGKWETMYEKRYGKKFIDKKSE